MGLRKLGRLTKLGYLPAYLLANRPSAASMALGQIILISDVGYGGSYWRNDGTYWRPVGGSVLLYSLAAESVSALITGSQVLAQYSLPAGIFQLGGNIRVRTWWHRTGTTDSIIYVIRINSGSIHYRVSSVGTNLSSATTHELFRLTSTSVQRGGVGLVGAVAPVVGDSTTTVPLAPLTVNDLDSASNTIDVVANVADGAADGINDTATLKAFTVEYVA